jgi:RNA polymerase sigma-70 factor, ECF subfamily
VARDQSEDTQTGNLTSLLNRMQSGDREAGDQAVALVYTELKRIASRQLRRERPGHTLVTAALVNEAYLRLSGGAPVPVVNRGHFFAIASRQMRRILVEHARVKNSEKRGGRAVYSRLEEAEVPSASLDFDVLSLDAALKDLESIDPRAAQIVELRYFGGYTDKEVVEALGVGLPAVRRDWDFARCWLYNRMQIRTRPGAPGK